MRLMTVSQLINELLALGAPGAIVNVTVTVGDYTYDGPAEVVEKVHTQEGPAVRICARNGAESDA
jgi:hypothetical protein